MSALLAMVVLFPAYSGSIVSSLTVHKPVLPFTDLEGLFVNGRYKITTVNTSFIPYFFQVRTAGYFLASLSHLSHFFLLHFSSLFLLRVSCMSFPPFSLPSLPYEALLLSPSVFPFLLDLFPFPFLPSFLSLSPPCPFSFIKMDLFLLFYLFFKMFFPSFFSLLLLCSSFLLLFLSSYFPSLSTFPPCLLLSLSPRPFRFPSLFNLSPSSILFFSLRFFLFPDLIPSSFPSKPTSCQTSPHLWAIACQL